MAEEFTDNLEAAEVPAIASTSHDSDSERPAKVVSRKHSVHTHFPKDRNAEYVCEPKSQGLLAEDALATLCLEQKRLLT